MPTVGVKRDLLFKALGKTYTEEAFEELCFEFGIELDDVTSEELMFRKEQGQKDIALESDKSENVIYKIDVCANRYDLLCLEGLARALNIFLGKMKTPIFKTVKPESPLVMTVHPDTAKIRPFVVCAVLRNVTFDKASYNSFIDLQDKLHQNICRRRTLVAIGTHDLDTLTPPFTYEALKPTDIEFCPLNQTKSMNAAEMMKFYETDNKLKKFLHIIRDSPVYPVIYDAKRTVLSMPPIINGNHSAIKLTTKNVFIEMTATDLTKAHVVLNTVVTMFSEYCKDKFTVEEVKVVMPNKTETMTPNLSCRTVDVSVDYINKNVGIEIEGAPMVDLLNRMQLTSTLSDDKKMLSVQVPPTRSDILHACDVMEDVAIAYGYNKIQMTVPPTVTIGKQLPINKLSDTLRGLMAQSGFTEVLNMALVSRAENFDNLRRKEGKAKSAVVLANPKTIDFEVARTTLLAGILKTLCANKMHALPIKVFECSDVVLLDKGSDVGAVNRRRLAGAYVGQNSGLEVIHGTVDRILQQLDVKRDQEGKGKNGYYIAESDDPTFFPGRRANVLVNGQVIGGFGIVHPEVLENFGVPFACSAFELDLHVFLKDKTGGSKPLTVDSARVSGATRQIIQPGAPVAAATQPAQVLSVGQPPQVIHVAPVGMVFPHAGMVHHPMMQAPVSPHHPYGAPPRYY